jgi:hypothetical protein
MVAICLMYWVVKTLPLRLLADIPWDDTVHCLTLTGRFYLHSSSFG